MNTYMAINYDWQVTVVGSLPPPTHQKAGFLTNLFAQIGISQLKRPTNKNDRFFR